MAKVSTPPGPPPILTRPPTGHPDTPGHPWPFLASLISFGQFLLPIRLLPGHFSFASWTVRPWKSETHFGPPATMERGVQDTGHCVTMSPNCPHHHHHPMVSSVDGGDEHCGLQLELHCNQELRCERSALTVPLLRQDPPAYAKASPSSPASSTLTTSTLLSPSLLPPYPRPSSPPPPYSPPPQPPSRRLLVVLTVVIMLLSSLTVGIAWKHWELMSSMQQLEGKKVDHAPASPPPRYTLGPESCPSIFYAFLTLHKIFNCF